MNMLQWSQLELNLPTTLTGFIGYIVVGMVCWHVFSYLTRCLCSLLWPAIVLSLVIVAVNSMRMYQPELYEIFAESNKTILGAVLYVVAKFFEIMLEVLRCVLKGVDAED